MCFLKQKNSDTFRKQKTLLDSNTGWLSQIYTFFQLVMINFGNVILYRLQKQINTKINLKSVLMAFQTYWHIFTLDLLHPNVPLYIQTSNNIFINITGFRKHSKCYGVTVSKRNYGGKYFIEQNSFHDYTQPSFKFQGTFLISIV